MNSKHLLATILLMTISSLFHLAAQSEEPGNNYVAFAYPVEEIQIDGDVNEWPLNQKRYPIKDVPFGDGPSSMKDFYAEFMIGYNLEEQSIYVAVIVKDDIHVTDQSETSDWNTQDIHNFYLDPNYSQAGSGQTLYSFNNGYKEIADASTHWDPAVRNINWDHIDVQSNREGNQTTYEWKVMIGEHCKVGKSIGIDHVIIDQDADADNTFISWNPGSGKSRSFGRLGQAILMTRMMQTGIVEGEITWRDNAILQVPPKRIVMTSITDPDLWALIKINDAGTYKQELPVGQYEVSLFQGFDEGIRTDLKNDRVQTTVKANRTVQAPTLYVSSLEKPTVKNKKGWMLNNPKDFSVVDKFVNRYMEHYDIPGVSLALVKGDDVVYHQTFGVENTYTKEPVDETTLFEAASITKPVFAFAVCRLAERGVIDLDKPLYQYLPFEEIAYDERYKLITGKHVLCHQTGFPNWARMNDDGRMDIKFDPGTEYGYSGEGFEYLKRVVTHVTKKDMVDILEEEVMAPLGLENIYFKSCPELAKTVSHGHFDNRPTKADLPAEPGMAWSMHTEAREFSKFIVGIKNRVGLKSKTYSRMFRKNTRLPNAGEYFGLGFWFADTPVGRVFGHGGNNGDFKCRAYYYEDLEFGLVIFTNANTGDFLIDGLIKFLVMGNDQAE